MVVKAHAPASKRVSSACYYFILRAMMNLWKTISGSFVLRSWAPFVGFFLVAMNVFGFSALSAAQKSKPPSQVEEIYAQGMQALQRGDLPAAETAFNKVLRLAPSSAEAHNSLGWVLQAEEKMDPAIREFQAAIKLKPDFPQVHINLSNAFLRSGNRAGALREAREAVRLAPSDSEARRTLARVFDASGDLTSAIEEMRRAIAVEPNRAELHDDLGPLLAQQD